MIKKKFELAVKTYNKIAKLYFKYTFHKLSQYQLNKFISMLPKKAKILDAGCGSGRDAQYFKEDGFEVTAIDAAEKMVEEAKKNVKDVKFEHMDMLNLKFEDESFDGVWACASLLHNEKTDLPKILGELKRVLKENGTLYVSVKEGEGEKIVKDVKYNNEPQPTFYYKQAEIEKELKDAGFQIVHLDFNKDILGRSGIKWMNVYCRKITS